MEQFDFQFFQFRSAPDSQEFIPDADPTSAPTKKPTIPPTTNPSKSPTSSPTNYPTTPSPTGNPTTWAPTKVNETRSPSKSPTNPPTTLPSISPTTSTPTTSNPTKSPSISTIVAKAGANSGAKSNGNSAMKIFSLPAIPIQGLCALIILSMFFGICYYFCISKEHSEQRKIVTSIKIPVIFTFICNFLAVVCCMIVTIILATTIIWDNERRNMALIPFYGAVVLYSFGKFCLESFFILRVYNAFKGSAFEVSKSVIISLFILMFIISSLWCYIFIADVEDYNQFIPIPYYSYVIISGLEAILIIILLYLFTKRLTKLLLLQKYEKSIELSTTKSRTRQSIKSSMNMPSSPTPTIQLSPISREVNINDSSPRTRELTIPQSPQSMERVTSDSGDCGQTPTFADCDPEIMMKISTPSPPSPQLSPQVSVVDDRPEIGKNNGGSHSHAKTLSMRFDKIRVMSISAMESRYSTADIKSVQKNLSQKQTKLIFVITRCILLSSIALITTLIFGLMAFYYTSFGLHIFIIYALWSIDMTMNCICLYLNFIFADKLYKKCCRICHGCCQNIFEYCAAKKILNDHLDEQQSANYTH